MGNLHVKTDALMARIDTVERDREAEMAKIRAEYAREMNRNRPDEPMDEPGNGGADGSALHFYLRPLCVWAKRRNAACHGAGIAGKWAGSWAGRRFDCPRFMRRWAGPDAASRRAATTNYSWSELGDGGIVACGCAGG